MNQSYFLYAEDDQDDIDILKAALTCANGPARVDAVSNGYDVLTYLQEVQVQKSFPCLIILDNKLPRLSGLETLKLLKTDDMYRLIPVVVFTALLSADEKALCLSLGADVLVKPAQFASWNEIIAQMCSYIDD